ncbi:MAG TPA: hypothetical protein VJ826_12045 [Candidatus Polarisedimenticolaceae bacterium]|nr:hypothetical protein [Candidatus Polarisedimenticolaceae bacterium]
MSPRPLLVVCFGILLSACGHSSPARVAKSKGLDPLDLEEYHLHRLDGTQNCAKVRVCDDAVTTDPEVAQLGINPDYESWPQGAIP